MEIKGTFDGNQLWSKGNILLNEVTMNGIKGDMIQLKMEIKGTFDNVTQ